jgi:NAD+ synthase
MTRIKDIGEREVEKIAEFISRKAAGFRGVTLGMSGGIDSSVAATLCCRALGKEKVLALLMPFGHQSTEDAEAVAEQLGIEYKIINIKPVVDIFTKTSDFYRKKLPLGNLMARIRMCLLYGAANSQKRLVVGSSNKSELLTGYFTRYGDGGADILPIGGLYKTQVLQLARILELPEKIIRKKPSAGLWEGQTDEGELGISYRKLDLILHELVDEKKEPDGIDIQGMKKEEIKRIAEMVEKSGFKRRMPDVCMLDL